MNLSRLRRLLSLIGLLQAGRGSSVEGLAQDLSVSRRTVFRDLDVLREAGVPVIFDEDHRRHRIPGQSYLPATSFTAQEALALLMLCHEMGDRAGLPFFGPARAAALKIESSMPGRLRDHLRQLSDAVTIGSTPRNPLDGQQPVYDQLLEAIGRRQCVRIRYTSFSEEQTIQTRLSPYRLLFSRRSWYVIGRSTLHRAVRTFNVGRILQLTPLDETFRVPPRFSLERYLRNAWHLIPEPGPDWLVWVRFSKLVARNVAEVAWHKTQQVHFNADGTLDFRAKVSGLGEITWWILGYGEEVEVIEPAALRQRVADHARRMTAMYGGDELRATGT